MCIAYFALAQKSESGLKSFGLKGKVKVLTEYTFKGKKGRLDTLHSISKIVVEFNENGNITSESVDGVLKEKSVYDYSLNKTVVVNSYDSKGNVTSQIAYKLDRDDNEVEANTRSVSGQTYKYMMKYNTDGKILEQEDYKGTDNTPFAKIVSHYDNNGELSEQDSFGINGQLQIKRTVLYDSINNVSHQETLYPIIDSQLIESINTVNLDKNGNWQLKTIEGTQHFKTKPDWLGLTIIKRELTYY